MTHILKSSHRCELFEKIAREVWGKVSRNRIAGIHTPETGITNNIIADIRTHTSLIPNFGVWSNNGRNETNWGSDIDIFVEVVNGDFIWYALQAKVLYVNGRYDDLHTLKGGEDQWKKLERLQKQSGCEVNYLLYNGVPEYRYNGRDMCHQRFNEELFGCSIIPLSSIIGSPNPASFLDFHHASAQPWHVLVCCFKDVGDYTTFSSTQIRRAVDYYPNKVNTEILGEQYDYQGGRDENVNAIIDVKVDTEWKPDVSIVIRNTSSLK